MQKPLSLKELFFDAISYSNPCDTIIPPTNSLFDKTAWVALLKEMKHCTSSPEKLEGRVMF